MQILKFCLKFLVCKYFYPYDETTNNASRKELQIEVRYWSETLSEIVTQHLQTYFIGGAKATDLKSKLYQALDSAALPMKKLLMLGSDGPNMNKKVMKLVNEDLVVLRNKQCVDLGTCNIHILHNAFLKGLDELGDVSNFIIAIDDFFDGWPSRWEDFEAIQNEFGLPQHRFLKHVSSRWLTLEDSAGGYLHS